VRESIFGLSDHSNAVRCIILVSKGKTPKHGTHARDRREKAMWAGCNRSIGSPLENIKNMDVSIRSNGSRRRSQPDNRLSQEEYNSRMFTSDYCIILCGDTVTSRALTSSIVYGCIPIRVGSRLRGLCESPCHEGWGWKITGEDFPHLPFSQNMVWAYFPEVNEQKFSEAPLARYFTLQRQKRNQEYETICCVIRWVGSTVGETQ
jgi:hypothetical protein